MPYMLTKDDVEIYYKGEGKGKPIVFIHPPLINSHIFIKQRPLTAHFRLISFDIRGHGESSFSPQALTYQLIVDDLIQLLDHLEIERCFVCGYSTGGAIALEVMHAYPQRFYGGILLSAMSEVSDRWLHAKISAACFLSKLRLKRPLAAIISLGNANAYTTFKVLYHEALKGDLTNMQQYFYASQVHNCTAKCADIALPQLLLYGAKDRAFHSYAAILSEQLPHHELHFIANGQHQLPTKSATQVNGLIKRWIDDLM